MINNLNHTIVGLVPAADSLAGTKTTDIFTLKGHQKAEFAFLFGAGAVGTHTFTVQACDNNAGANPEAIKFYYQVITSGDTHSAVTLAATTGFTVAAGANKIVKIFIDSNFLAASGKSYCYAKSVEVVDDPVVAGCIITLSEGKLECEQHPTVL